MAPRYGSGRQRNGRAEGVGLRAVDAAEGKIGALGSAHSRLVLGDFALYLYFSRLRPDTLWHHLASGMRLI